MKTKNGITYFLSSLIIGLLLLRILLFIFPTANLVIGSYSIHHIFTGSVLLIITTILLILNITNYFTYILGGISTALIIDQLTFLIMTDGTNKTYFSQTSVYGAFILTFIIILIVIGLYLIKENKK